MLQTDTMFCPVTSSGDAPQKAELLIRCTDLAATARLLLRLHRSARLLTLHQNDPTSPRRPPGPTRISSTITHRFPLGSLRIRPPRQRTFALCRQRFGITPRTIARAPRHQQGQQSGQRPDQNGTAGHSVHSTFHTAKNGVIRREAER